jgi:cell division septal protein FtsQ
LAWLLLLLLLLCFGLALQAMFSYLSSIRVIDVYKNSATSLYSLRDSSGLAVRDE